MNTTMDILILFTAESLYITFPWFCSMKLSKYVNMFTPREHILNKIIGLLPNIIRTYAKVERIWNDSKNLYNINEELRAYPFAGGGGCFVWFSLKCFIFRAPVLNLKQFNKENKVF